MIRRAMIAAAVSMLSMPAAALAHAMLERANPMVGAIVHAAPGAISLRFSEPVEPALCSVSLSRSDGIGAPLAAFVANDHGRVLSAAVRSALAPGIYRVHWRVVSVDTHVTQGDFSFTIAP